MVTTECFRRNFCPRKYPTAAKATRSPTTEKDKKTNSETTKFEVHISSVPSDATIVMTNTNNEKMVVGNTPFVGSITRSEIKFLEIEKKGYHTKKILPSSSNTEFEIVLEAEKKTYKKKTKRKNLQKQPTEKKEQETQPKETSNPKSSGELKNPW